MTAAAYGRQPIYGASTAALLAAAPPTPSFIKPASNRASLAAPTQKLLPADEYEAAQASVDSGAVRWLLERNRGTARLVAMLRSADAFAAEQAAWALASLTVNDAIRGQVGGLSWNIVSRGLATLPRRRAIFLCRAHWLVHLSALCRHVRCSTI